MAAGGNSSFEQQRISQGFQRALSSAILEWLLIFLLFIDAIFSYLITTFARYCELQTPCLLCSRLDHVLGNKKLKSYWDLFCGKHKLEISSLVFCHAHNKLVDVHGMCENCLFSFATINKSNTETYRLLLGKLGVDSTSDFDEDPLLLGHNNNQSSIKHCSCCNEQWIPRGYAQKLVPTRSFESKAAELDVPLSASDEHNLHYLKMRSEKRSAPIRVTHVGSSGLDPLSHVGYTELKITSDSESDDDDANGVMSETNGPMDDLAHQCEQLEPRIITLPHDSVLKKLIDPISEPEPLPPVSQLKSDVSKTDNCISVESTTIVGYGLEELNWEQVHFKADSSALTEVFSVFDASSNAEKTINVSKDSKLICHDVPPSNSSESLADVTKKTELITHDQVPLSSNAETPVDIPEESKLNYHDIPLSSNVETPVDISEESKLNHHDVPLSSNSKISLVGVTKERELILVDEVQLSSNAETPVDVSEERKLLSINDVPSSSNGRETPFEVSTDGKVVPLDDVLPLSKSTESPVEAPKQSCITDISNEKSIERNPVSSDSGLQASNLLDLSDAYKVAVGTRGRQLSGVLAEQWMGKDSSRLSEDLKLLLSQLSAARGFEQLVSDMSPKVSLNSDELKTSDASSSNGMHILQKRISLERNESGFESLDGSSISEIEGESVVDRLKRQVEHDKKLLSALYKELEEERNASADAVNQAMAMITRLQEEKASLHMEALQNLRMMEEQAEYDMEALQKTNDLLAEKEKEIQDLEEELEFYRKKFPDESMVENKLKPTDEFNGKEIRMVHSEENTCGQESAAALKNSVVKNPRADLSSKDMEAAGVKNSLLEFEDERWYILQSLKKLEKKLYMFSYNGHCSGLANGESSGNGDGVSDSKDLNCTRESQLNCGTEGNDLPMLNDASATRGSPLAQGHVSSLEKPPLTSKENNEIDCGEPSSQVLCRGMDLNSVGNAVSDLNERLEALEADQKFLELTINSLKTGEEGIRFIQEIASHLRELRSIGIRRDESYA